MINAISKRNIAKTTKSIKLMLVVPARILGAEGSYGIEFK